MADSNFALGFRLGLTLMTSMVALATAASLVATIVATIASSPEPPIPQSGDFPYKQTLLATVVVSAPVLLAPLTFHSKGFGAKLPLSPTAPRFFAAAGLAWLAMGSTGVANSLFRVILGDPQFEGLGVTDGEMTFLAFNAGISEEAAYIAVPTGLLFLAGSLLNLRRERSGNPAIPHRTLWLTSATVGPLLFLAGRSTGHLYQGTASAVLGVVWGAALIAVFVWARSIWPVMLGHVIYDLPVHFNSWSGLISYHVIAPAIIAGVSIALMRKHRNRQNYGGVYPA